MLVASVVTSAERLVAARRRAAVACRHRHHRQQRRGGQRAAAEQVAPQRAAGDRPARHRSPSSRCRGAPCRATSSGMPVKRTARRAVIGWLNGVRGAPKVPGTLDLGVLDDPNAARRPARRRPCASPPPPGAPPDWPGAGPPGRARREWAAGRRRAAPSGATVAAGARLEVEQLHHQLGPGRAVEHGMVELHDHPGTAVGQPLDDVHLPQRPMAVERAGQHVGGDGLEVGGLVDACSDRPDRRRRRSNRVACSRGGDRRGACAAPAAGGGGHRSARRGSAATQRRASSRVSRTAAHATWRWLVGVSRYRNAVSRPRSRSIRRPYDARGTRPPRAAGRSRGPLVDRAATFRLRTCRMWDGPTAAAAARGRR